MPNQNKHNNRPKKRSGTSTTKQITKTPKKKESISLEEEEFRENIFPRNPSAETETIPGPFGNDKSRQNWKMTQLRDLSQRFRKKFKDRDSILSQLINHTQHIRTLYNIILSLVFVFFISIATEYATNSNIAHKDLSLVYWNLRQFFPHFTTLWSVMQLNVFIVYYGIAALRWSLQLSKLQSTFKVSRSRSSKETDKQVIDSQFIVQNCSLTPLQEYSFWAIHLANLSVLTWFITKSIWVRDLSISMTFALTMELARFVMKSHSYFIEKRLENVTEEELIKVCKSNSYPSISSFLYYLFSPTLIYRDSYPRTAKIHFRFVVVNFVQFLAGIIIVFLMIERFLIESFSKVGLEDYALTNLAKSFRNVFMFGAILNFVVFYTFLHTYHNATAELLRFSDRQFYKEWWQSMNMSDYYRKWNVIVQDWLFTYLYQPIRCWSGSNLFTAFAVILISGVAHEYIIGMALGFLFPALFFFFAVFGHIYFLLTKNVTPNNVHNIFSIFSILFGWGFISTLYALEYYSRKNCPLTGTTPTVADYVIPRMFSCVRIQV